MLKIGWKRILPVITALAILLSLPVSIFTTAEDFVPENLLMTDLAAKKTVVKSIADGTVQDHTQFDGNGTLAIINDGDTATTADAYGANDWGNHSGVVFTLNNTAYCGKVSIYSGFTSLTDTYDVYAAETEADLYKPENKIGEGVVCDGNEQTVTVEKDVKYLAVFLTDYTYNGRVAEIQLWSAQKKETQVFTPENLLMTGLKAKKTVVKNITDGTVQDHTQFDGNGTLAIINDGDTATKKDAYGANDWGNHSGIVFELNTAAYCGKVSLFAGYTEFTDTYDVYAAETEADLYNADNKIGEGVVCDGTEQTVTVGKDVKYLAVFLTDYTYNGRIAEIQLWSAQKEETPVFTSENLLKTDLSDKKAIVKTVTTGEVSEHNQFDGNGTLAILNDGDTATKKDAYGANDWTPSSHSGVLFTLNTATYCGKVSLFAGYTEMTDTYDVYAAETEADLYDSENKIGSSIVCDGTEQTVTVGKKVKYLAVFLTGYTYNGRIAEIELWSAEEPTTPEKPDNKQKNLLITDLAAKKTVIKNISTGEVSDHDHFNGSGTLAILNDGDTTTTADAYGANDWGNHSGVVFTLNNATYCGKVSLFAGYTEMTDTYDVYAAETEADLYNAENKIGSSIVCDGTEQTVTVGKKVKYLAVFLTGYTYNGRIAEIQLWSAEEPTTPEKPDNKQKNLLITDLKSKKTVIRNIKNGEVADHDHFNGNGTLAIINDGDTTTTADAYGANDWGNHSGVVFEINTSTYCEKVTIYAGFPDLTDTYDVYAAAKAEDLYRPECKIGKGVVCDGTEITVPVGKHVKYLAVFLTGYSGNGRMAEVELWSGEIPEDYDPSQYDFKDPYDPAAPSGDDVFDPSNPNFIYRHFSSAAGVLQNVASGVFSDGDRFTTADPNALSLAIDGDSETFFDVYGALDWEFPNNVGARYQLDAVYPVKTARITAGDSARPVKIAVYASDSVGTLFKETNLLKTVTCKGAAVDVTVNKDVGAIAFIITSYDLSSCPTVAEFDLTGSDKAVQKKVISWPAAPAGGNLLAGAAPSEIIAPGGDFLSAKEFDYRFMNVQTESDLSKLTDGDLTVHYDIWSLTATDKPGVLYDLGAYYDLSHLHAWAGASGSELITNFGYRVYASASLETLFKKSSLVSDYLNEEDTTNEFAQNVKLGRIRYLAFFLTGSSDGGWRMREFAAYGVKSADQSEPPVQVSIIEELEAEYYGVATDNLADPVYMGASDYVTALTDGKRDSVEFWGGSDIQNSKFVFIYNLYANYDLTGVEIYAFADSIEEDSGIHKGIRSAKVYAARKLDQLFTSDPIVLKTDYDDPKSPDENAYYAGDAKAEWKGVRYIAYVFTIGDSRYGACRLEELRAFGTESAVQDAEEEETVLPEYIDLDGGNGIVLRLYALDRKDDLSKLGARLSVEAVTEGEDFNFVEEQLTAYKAQTLYRVSILSSNGSPLKTNGRLMRLSIPADDDCSIACIDDYSAEIVATGILNKCLTVETETLRSYALVKAVKGASSVGSLFANFPLVPVAVVGTGVLAAVGVSLSALSFVWSRKK